MASNAVPPSSTTATVYVAVGGIQLARLRTGFIRCTTPSLRFHGDKLATVVPYTSNGSARSIQCGRTKNPTTHHASHSPAAMRRAGSVTPWGSTSSM